MTEVQETLTESLKLGRRCRLVYHGEERFVEVHAIGLSTKGNPVTRVYQVIGGSVFSEKTGWKLMKVSDIEEISILEDESAAPREGYSPGDRGMSEIYLEV